MEVPGKIQAEGQSLVCEPCCIEDTSTQADGYCEECQEYMCNNCFRYHLKSKPCRHHILSSLSQGQMQGQQKEQDKQPCQKHTNEKLKYYCSHHDQVVCGDCIVAEHKGCDMVFIKDVARKFETSSEFKNMLNNIARLQEESAKNKTTQDKNRLENNAMTKTALKEIRKIRKELNDYLDHAEADMINEATRLSKENDDLITQLEAKLNKVKLDFDDLNSRVDTNLYKQDKLFIHYLECKSRVNEVEIVVDDVIRNSKIKQFFFQPNQQISKLVMSKIKLGTVNVEEIQLDYGSHDNGSATGGIQEVKEKMNTRGQARRAEEVLQQEKETRDQARGAEKVLQQGKKTRGRARRATKKVQKKTTRDTNLPSQQYRDPDPRARGFDVGKRVTLKNIGKTGTVTSVDPWGLVAVQWDNGIRYAAVYAGYNGRYYLDLI